MKDFRVIIAGSRNFHNQKLLYETMDNLHQREQGILRYDVGVDANDFFPVSINEILSLFNY